jgi:peptidoglycan/xylan/chitin deacetylase (PgdA/CDA1 family)
MMIPSGGISLLVHTLVNIVCSIAKYPRKAVPYLAIFIVAAIVVTSGSISVVNSLEEKNNFQLIQEIISPCAPVKQAYSDNQVILRVDDIQADAYESVAKSIIKDADKYNMRLVLGIIPRNFLKDKKMARIVRMNNCNLEIAMHGWGHFSDEDNSLFEFENMEEMEARTKIEDGKNTLEEVSKKPIVTFIPPGNEISDETKKVLDEEGIKYISANEGSGKFDMTVSAYDFPNKVLLSTDEILQKCVEKFNGKKKGPCVIVIHPQSYMTDGQPDNEKYKAFTDLLENLRKIDVYSVTFSDLEQLIIPEVIPSEQRQSRDPAIPFQTLPHPFQKDSTKQTYSIQFSSHIQSYL